MRSLPLTILLACFIASFTPGCGLQQSPSIAAQTITGRERLGWNQQAPDANELSYYSFVLYVDGLPVALPYSTCGIPAVEPLNAPCSSPLPPLLPGQHRLELATRKTWNGKILESARSAPLIVMVERSGSTGSASLTKPDEADAVPIVNLLLRALNV